MCRAALHSLVSSTNIRGSSSPSGRAVVTIRCAMPEPLPKCLSPVSSYVRPTRNGSPSTADAVDLVRLMSPPLPGSDVMVPHCSPAAALANTARRCSSQAGCAPSGLSSQNDTTDGCIADTRATAGSAEPSSRNVSQIGRADTAASRHNPPSSSGTTPSRKPASRSASKSRCSRWRRVWRSARCDFHSAAIGRHSSGSVTPSAGIGPTYLSPDCAKSSRDERKLEVVAAR